MVSKSQIKLITSLEQKKNRERHGLFIAEGIKGITELLNSQFELEALYTTDSKLTAAESKTILITEAELKKISRLKTPQVALALFKIPERKLPELQDLTLALDGVRDPGNLGTIIRLCDWFGINNLLCSKDTVDCYNTKVVQATMGSISRVNIYYEDLEGILNRHQDTPVIGTYMDGDDIYRSNVPPMGILIMGNEANGISPKIEKFISHKVGIPQFGEGSKTESLNVATATAILLSEFRRRNY